MRDYKYFFVCAGMLAMTMMFGETGYQEDSNNKVIEKGTWQGPHGYRGHRGKIGSPGATGSVGIPGPTGPQGNTAPTSPTGQLTVTYLPQPSDPIGAKVFHFEVIQPDGSVLVQPAFIAFFDGLSEKTFTIGPPLQLGSYSFQLINDNPADFINQLAPLVYVKINNNFDTSTFYFEPTIGSPPYPFTFYRSLAPLPTFGTQLNDAVMFMYTTDFGR